MNNIDDGSLITQPLINDQRWWWQGYSTPRKCFPRGSLSGSVSTLSLHHLFDFLFMDSQQSYRTTAASSSKKNHHRTKYICFPGTCQCKKMSVSLISYWTKIGMCKSSTDVLPPGVLCVLYTRTSTGIGDDDDNVDGVEVMVTSFISLWEVTSCNDKQHSGLRFIALCSCETLNRK